MAGHGRRRVAVLALELADRGVRRVGPGRHDVRHGRQIEVDARRAQLSAPSGGPRLERRRRQRPLARARTGSCRSPGPDSAWTSPPSWLAATKKRTPPVAADVAWAWTASVIARTRATPIEVFVVNDTEPKWSVAIAERSAVPSVSLASPIMNSWPIRCASVSSHRVWVTHVDACVPLDEGVGTVRRRRLRSGGRRRRLHRRAVAAVEGSTTDCDGEPDDRAGRARSTAAGHDRRDQDQDGHPHGVRPQNAIGVQVFPASWLISIRLVPLCSVWMTIPWVGRREAEVGERRGGGRQDAAPRLAAVGGGEELGPGRRPCHR